MIRAYLVCLLVYVAAVVVACGVGWLLVDWPVPAVLLLVGVAATAVIFGFSRAYGNSSLYDPYWSVAPSLMVLWFAWEAQSARSVLVFGLVFLWTVRFLWNFFHGWEGLQHEDWRYPLLKGKAKSALQHWQIDFFNIHMFPTLTVYVAILPVWAALSLSEAPLGVLDAVAALVTFGGLVLETVADEQLRGFRKNPQNQGKTLTTGLWRFSRHPNYLGECLFWWGLFGFCLAATPSYGWLVFAPIAMVLMFLGVSIPLMEGRCRRRRPDYEDYKRRTSMLLLWPPRA